jgi:hypothetical protein
LYFQTGLKLARSSRRDLETSKIQQEAPQETPSYLLKTSLIFLVHLEQPRTGFETFEDQQQQQPFYFFQKT